MIVRVWKACAMREKAALYREHLLTVVFPVMQSVDGFMGVQLLERDDGDQVEFLVETRWASMDAVRLFAGDAYEKAVVAPAARSVLLAFDDHVTHYEVSLERAP
jgi:heme-degrading monooxygenase HmoA